LTSNELRKSFLEFFKGHDHKILPSSSLVPVGDPSLLWTSAGMVPFKKFFAGLATPPHPRVATCQKCLRTPDIESVGRTARHHTFFEMLGNFSFGDYFKKEAIAWSWEYITKVVGLPVDRLWITVYEDDDEAYSIWHKTMNVSESRIVRMGKDTNFWEIGLGACGPCSEIHFDQGEGVGCGRSDCGVDCDCDRFLEIWNLVFTQFDQQADGSYKPLPKKNIDTGMGLERLTAVVQGVYSNFDTDLFQPLIQKVATMAGTEYRRDPQIDLALRVIADHSRAVTFALSDGVLPSNEGRGYVIRRLLRRAVRFGRVLGINNVFLYKVAESVVDVMKDAYPELEEKSSHIFSVITNEEKRFRDTLEQGSDMFEKIASELVARDGKIISGKDVFKLYDTFGLPLELTKEMAAELGLGIDEEGFHSFMEEQRRRARSSREDLSGWDNEEIYVEMRDVVGKTEFVGYEMDKVEARITGILKDGQFVETAEEGETVEIVLDRTPFYAESGGQVADGGRLYCNVGSGDVLNVTSPVEGLTLHTVKISKGKLGVGNEVLAEIDFGRRRATEANHTSTHLLHRALKDVLGEHVNQSGSLVEPERLRFDFSHFCALTAEEISEIERRVNEKILEDLQVTTEQMSLEEARNMRVVAIFEEKYGDVVRVVRVGDYTAELCGGTHVRRTGEIGSFKIISEGAIAAGARRIEAVTRWGALSYVAKRDDVLSKTAALLKSTIYEVPEKVGKLLEKMEELENQVFELKRKQAREKVNELVENVQSIDGIPVIAAVVNGVDIADLRNMGDVLTAKLGSGIVLLGSTIGSDKVIFLCMVTSDLVKKGVHAGNIVREAAMVAGGNGGGRPDMAQAGGKIPEKAGEAVERGKIVIRDALAKG
jgi:alanyl-tRNA synthetase